MDAKARLDRFLTVHKNELVNFIKLKLDKKLGNFASAEDVLSEVFAYALSHPSDVEKRSDENLAIFLKWKSKMIIFDLARLSKKLDPNVIANKVENVSEHKGSAESPSLLLHRQDKRHALRNYISMIKSPEQRLVMELVRLEGMSPKEVAEKLGKERAAVEKLLQRGFASLVSMLRASGGMKFATSGETT